MPQSYNGSAAAITAHQQVTISEPIDTDVRSSQSVRTPLEKLADYLQFLQANAALLDQLNVLTQTLQLSGGDLELTKATVQAILKATGGKLQVGTKAGNASDVELLVNGVVKAALLAAGGFDVKSQRIVNVTDPAGPQDADTKAARDAALTVLEAALDARVDALEAKESRTAKAWGRIQTGAAGAATVVDGVGVASASWNGTNLTIVLSPAMPDANYCCVHGGGKAGVVFGYNPAMSTAGQVVLSQSVNFESGYIYNFAIFN